MIVSGEPYKQYAWLKEPQNGGDLALHRGEFVQTFYRAITDLGSVALIVVGSEAHKCMFMCRPSFEPSQRYRSLVLPNSIVIGRFFDVPVVYTDALLSREMLFLNTAPSAFLRGPVDTPHVRVCVVGTVAEALDAGIDRGNVLPTDGFDLPRMNAELDLIRSLQFLSAAHQPT